VSGTVIEPVPTPVRPEPDRQPKARGRSRHALLGFLEAYTLLILLVVAAVFFSVYGKTADTFPTAANLQILVSSQAVTAIVALAALVPLVCNEFDLSVGAVTGLSAVMSASLLSDSMNVLLALAVGVALGVAIGLVNALLVTRMGVNGVITTLGTATVLGGVVVQKTGGIAVDSNIPKAVTDFGSLNALGIPRVAFAMVLVALVVYYLLEHTPLGRQIYALGSNRAAAELVGIRTSFVLAATFVLAGGLSAVAGVIYVARAGGADPGVGEAFTLPALAAAFLSAAAVKPGKYNVGGTLVAIFFLAVLNNGLNLAGAPPYVTSYVNGAALVVGVALAASLHRQRASTGRRATAADTEAV
jgi:ribose transport system permease protein